MENFPNSPKTPRELAVQISEANPFFGAYNMPEGHAAKLEEEARIIKAEVKAMDLYALSDEELMQKMIDIQARAIENGTWSSDKGIGGDERIEFATQRKKRFGSPGETARDEAIKDLERYGFLGAIEYSRAANDMLFNGPTSEYLDSHPMDFQAEQNEIESILKKTVDITTIADVEKGMVGQDFKSGNFLYHGTGTDQILKIFESGSLANLKALQNHEDIVAKAENREAESFTQHTGYEGISWSMNGIDALPGDRYHLAGFVASPELVLSANEQLAVPSRPAPNEVLQISAEVDSKKYYDTKTQLELYYSTQMSGEINSAYSNLITIKLWDDENYRNNAKDPLLYQVKDGILSQPEYQNQLKSLYSLEADGTIRFDPDLLQQTNNEIPVAAVWLQAAIDTGLLKETIFAGKEVSSIIDKLDSNNVDDLLRIMSHDWGAYEKVLDDADNAVGAVEIPVEKMYFVTSRKDAEKWLKVIACSDHRPAGILLYDDKKVKLENFVSSHRGDHAELTRELQTAIVPKAEYIDYSEVLGVKMEDNMRAGHKHQVIAERYLVGRKTIKNIDGKLVIEK